MPETVVHFQIRIPPELHERLATRARVEKLSLNALVVVLLRDAAAARRGDVDGPARPAAPPD